MLRLCERFRLLGADFRTTFRLRGVECVLQDPIGRRLPQMQLSRLSRRWKRHWLTLYSGSDIRPLSFPLWLAFPEKGSLSCYEEGFEYPQ